MQCRGSAGHRTPLDRKREEVEPQSEGEVEVLAGMSVTLREESTEVIDMWKSWIEGPKGEKVSEQGFENFGRG